MSKAKKPNLDWAYGVGKNPSTWHEAADILRKSQAKRSKSKGSGFMEKIAKLIQEGGKHGK